MASKRKNVIQLIVQRREGRPLGGPLNIHYDLTDKEKDEALNSMLWATFSVARSYGQADRLIEIFRTLLKQADAEKPAPAPTEGAHP